MWLRILLIAIAFLMTSVAPLSLTTARGEKSNLKTTEQDLTTGKSTIKTLENRNVGGKTRTEVQMPPGGDPPPPGEDPPPPASKSKGSIKVPKN